MQKSCEKLTRTFRCKNVVRSSRKPVILWEGLRIRVILTAFSHARAPIGLLWRDVAVFTCLRSWILRMRNYNVNMVLIDDHDNHSTCITIADLAIISSNLRRAFSPFKRMVCETIVLISIFKAASFCWMVFMVCTRAQHSISNIGWHADVVRWLHCTDWLCHGCIMEHHTLMPLSVILIIINNDNGILTIKANKMISRGLWITCSVLGRFPCGNYY